MLRAVHPCLIDIEAEFMKKQEFGRPFLVLLIVSLVPTLGLILALNIDHSYRSTIRGTRLTLMFTRRSIQLFAEQNGRFPDSLGELNEYGKKSPKQIQWYFPAKESIAGKANSREHAVLDGTGGLYYDRKTGELKLNLTKPLKSYWRFYVGKSRNDVPANW
jgi:hypothetical protein